VPDHYLFGFSPDDGGLYHSLPYFGAMDKVRVK